MFNLFRVTEVTDSNIKRKRYVTDEINGNVMTFVTDDSNVKRESYVIDEINGNVMTFITMK